MGCKKRFFANAFTSIITVMSLTLVAKANERDIKSSKRVVILNKGPD